MYLCYMVWTWKFSSPSAISSSEPCGYCHLISLFSALDWWLDWSWNALVSLCWYGDSVASCYCCGMTLQLPLLFFLSTSFQQLHKMKYVCIGGECKARMIWFDVKWNDDIFGKRWLALDLQPKDVRMRRIWSVENGWMSEKKWEWEWWWLAGTKSDLKGTT